MLVRLVLVARGSATALSMPAPLSPLLSSPAGPAPRPRPPALLLIDDDDEVVAPTHTVTQLLPFRALSLSYEEKRAEPGKVQGETAHSWLAGHKTERNDPSTRTHAHHPGRPAPSDPLASLGGAAPCARGEPADSASSTAASARVWRRAVLPVLDQHGRRRQD